VNAVMNLRVPYSLTILHFIIYLHFAVQSNRMTSLHFLACPAGDLTNFYMLLGLCMIVNL